MQEKVKEIEKKCISINELVVTEFSILKDLEGFENQIPILSKVENYKWKFHPNEIIERIRPKTGGFNFNQLSGVLGSYNTPPHINMAANIYAAQALIESTAGYIKLVSKLIRELEIKLGNPRIDRSTAIDNLNRVCDKFHKVAIQLRNRYNNRDTIKINDEYDVQDLMHAILKINFDDVRPEECSPSYAGKNTRIDFLLKNERIIIEVKKTRKTLKDAKIGNELILDIARYRNHPDCEILYCFVYDPQNYIENPIGLENDLMNSGYEDLNVIVKIVS